MGDRRRERSRGRRLIHVHQLKEAQARLLLRAPAAAALDQQYRNDDAL